jgi:glycolate oxidase FAD binding subunit
MDAALDYFIDRIKTAAAQKAPLRQGLRIRGGGSKDFYGEPFDPSLPVLDTRAHSGIVSYEPSELVITVKAGTPLAEVEALLAEQGQCFPFEPPHYRSGSTIGGKEDTHATIGGMVAAGLSGPARATAGSVRDYVLGAHLINGKGELLQFGGTVMKNVAGYDVSRLLAGSLGTLGLITQVSLKVLPLAPREATLRFIMDEATMIQTVNDWAGQPLPINASSWVMDQGAPTLYLRLRGAVAAVESACKMFMDKHGKQYDVKRVDSHETSADWSAARDLKLPWFEEGFNRSEGGGNDLWRLSVPPTAPPLALGDTMVDWLGGQRWVFCAAGDAQASQRIRQAAQVVQGSATQFIVSSEPSARVASRPELGTARLSQPSDALASIHRRLKQAFDPAGIFNPGRLGVV